MAVLLDDGVLYGWGENLSGQIVHDAWWALTPEPQRIIDIPCATKASIGTVGIGIARDGRAFTWGRESYGQRGDGPETSAAVFSWLSLTGVVDVSTRTGAIAAAARDGGYWWGDVFEIADAPTALDVRATVVSANPAASCLVSDAGKVMCWGSNFCGGYGCGLFPDGVVDAPTPLLIGVSGTAVSVAIDGLSACVLLASGEVECWGSNAVSQLGRGVDDQVIEQDPTPAPIVEAGPFVGLTNSWETVCAWRDSGEVYCWGSNPLGLRAPFDDVPWGEPRRIPELEPAAQVGLIADEVCSLGFDGLVRCRIPEPDPAKPQEARVMSFAGPEDDGGS